VPMAFPWKDLGLSLAWIDGTNGCSLYDFAKDKPVSVTPEDQVLLRISYSNDDSNRPAAVGAGVAAYALGAPDGSRSRPLWNS